MRIFLLMACLACLLACQRAAADEGMWTFDNFPAGAVKQRYGVDITPQWLERVRLATTRLANCTGTFVSANGLILTNHHCVEQCLAELSFKDKSLVEVGFAAPAVKDEVRCVDQQADILVDTEDISALLFKATSGLNDAAANEKRKKTLTSLEQACEQASSRSRSGALRCQAVKLYQGGQFFLYKYKRYSDVRLVFAPEEDIAAFGGDPDNFQYPRWSLDFSMLRAYEHGAPAKTPHFMAIDFAGPQAGEPVFVAGHPGSTARLQTTAQLKFDRDVALPYALVRTSELRGRYIEFGRADAADERIIRAPLDSLQNGIKVRRKELDALHDDALLAAKSAEEAQLRELSKLAAPDPWEEIQAATSRERGLYLPYTFIENAAGFSTVLFRDARVLVRGSEERTKPNDERLREFTDAQIPNIQRDLYARIPVYPQYEVLTLSFSLERMREWLGPDHPLVRSLFARESPEALATRLIAETKLDDAFLRRTLWQGGKSAVDASRDPLIELVRTIDPEARALRAQFENEVDAPITAAAQRIAVARFAAEGTKRYPDATFTLRLNYGTIEGWEENGVQMPPFTYLNRAFERATGASPFKMPDSWIKAKNRLDMKTPFCISSSNDIVGGNSGSPMINAAGSIVGLVFDGNIHSLAGRYWFDGSNNRAVALHPAIIREALQKVYGAQALLAELNP